MIQELEKNSQTSVPFDPKRNSTRIKELQGRFKSDGPLRFLRFTVERFHHRGDKESTIVEDIDLNGDGTPET